MMPDKRHDEDDRNGRLVMCCDPFEVWNELDDVKLSSIGEMPLHVLLLLALEGSVETRQIDVLSVQSIIVNLQYMAEK